MNRKPITIAGARPTLRFVALVAVAFAFAWLMAFSCHAQDAGATPDAAAVAKGFADAGATVVPAPTPPVDLNGAIGLLPEIMKDFAQGGPATLLGVGLLLMLVIYAFNTYIAPIAKIPSSYIPWISIALGVVSAFGAALASGQPIVPALIAGLVAGLAAVGKWEAGGKAVLPTKDN